MAVSGCGEDSVGLGILNEELPAMLRDDAEIKGVKWESQMTVSKICTLFILKRESQE